MDTQNDLDGILKQMVGSSKLVSAVMDLLSTAFIWGIRLMIFSPIIISIVVKNVPSMAKKMNMVYAYLGWA